MADNYWLGFFNGMLVATAVYLLTDMALRVVLEGYVKHLKEQLEAKEGEDHYGD